MDQIYYEQIMQLKREGKYQECIDIYMEHKNEEEADALFFDGLAKIYMLANNFDEAQKCLWESFRKMFEFRMKFFKKILDEKLETAGEFLYAEICQQEMLQATHLYKILSYIFGEDLVQAGGAKLTKEEYTMCLCECFNDTYFRYLFCLACQNKIPDNISDDMKKIVRELINAKALILKNFKGVATEQEQVEYEQLCNNFKFNKMKYPLIILMLVDFAHYIHLVKLADELFDN